MKTKILNGNSGKYVLQRQHGHLRADINGFVLQHILISEKTLGKPLPPNAEVHHIDGNGCNNAHNNLIICNDKGYHKLLHRRKLALQNTGNPHCRKCTYCQQWTLPENLYVRDKIAWHRSCHAEYRQNWNSNKGDKI